MDMDTGLDTTDTVWDTHTTDSPTVAMPMLVTTMPTQLVLSTLPSVPPMPSQQLSQMPMLMLTMDTMVMDMATVDTMVMDMVMDTDMLVMVMDMAMDMDTMVMASKSRSNITTRKQLP